MDAMGEITEPTMHYIARYSLCLSMALLGACGNREQPPAPASGKIPVAAGSEAVAIPPPQRADDMPQQAGPGRYQIVSQSQVRAGPFLLDTQTGRIWQLREFPGLEGAPSAWREMTIIDDRGAMGITTAQFQKLYPPRHAAPRRR